MRCSLSFTALLRGKQKTSFRSRPIPKNLLAKTECAAFSSPSQCGIFRTLSIHTKQKMYTQTDTPTRRPKYEHHVSNHSKSAGQRDGLQSKLHHRAKSCDNRRDRRHASGYELMCHLFGGRMAQQKRHKQTLRKAVLFFAHAYLTITIASLGRLTGHSLAWLGLCLFARLSRSARVLMQAVYQRVGSSRMVGADRLSM